MNTMKIVVVLLGLMIGGRMVAMDNLQSDIQDIKSDISGLLEKNQSNQALSDFRDRFSEFDKNTTYTKQLLLALKMLRGDITRVLGVQPSRVVPAAILDLAGQNKSGLQTQQLKALKTSIKLQINEIEDPATKADLESQFGQICQSQQDEASMLQSLSELLKALPSDDDGDVLYTGNPFDIGAAIKESKKNLTQKVSFFRPSYLVIVAGCVSCAVLIYRYFRSKDTQEAQRGVEQSEQDVPVVAE